MEIRIKKLNEKAIIPTSGSPYSAGYDIYSLEDHEIEAGKTVLAKTGLALEIPEGYFGAVYARSGLASKKGLRPANCVGVIDSDYRGELCIGLVNHGQLPYTVQPNDRVAQLMVIRHLALQVEVVDELEDTERGSGGFGSTGSN